MKRIAAKFLAVMAMAITTTASVFGQNGFSYQAVIRNAEGELITNKQVEVKFTLKHDGTNFYSEKQNVKTNEYGNIQVVVGNGEKIDGDFANVPWSSFDVKMEVAVDIDGKSIILGEVPVSGAPYAMYAQKAGGLTSKSANTKDGDALFAVNDANGNPVFAVFADGIVVYVDDTDATKAKRSGFVVTGREATKGDAATEYFSVTAEGTQIYVDDADNQNGKALRSGFVVTGRSATKNGETTDYLTVSDNGTTIYVDGDPDSYRDEKAMRSGFVVTGRSATKGGSEPQYFSATVDGTTIYIDDTSADKALRSGFVVTGREATKGGEADNYLAVDGNGTQVYVDGLDSDKALRSGFVVTGREASKAEEDTLFAIEGGYTRVYVDNDESDKAKRSGFVVTGRSATKDNTNIFNVSGEGNVDIKADFTVTDAITDAQEADTAAVQPQPGDTTETPAPVVDKPKNLFTVSSGNVQVGTEMVMMGDVTKKIEADTISIDSIEAEFPLIAKIIDRADTVSCAAYKPFVYGNDGDSAGYALLGIYSKGDLAKISATDARKNTVLLFDTYGNVTKYQRSATVAVLMPKGDSVLYIRPLKATSQTISFGLMKKNATEPYQYIKVEAEIEASAGVPYQVVAGSTEGGHVVINGTVAYGDQPTFEPVPNIGYKFVRWSDGNTRPKRTTTILDDYEISAEFERISYVVAVKSDNELFGTVSGEGTYLHGDTAMIEATPFTGYYFKNWSGTELNDSLQNSTSLALEITAELKLIANFDIMQYTITFDSDGGSEVAAITQDYDTEITAPADPQREGFRFRGWSPAIPERMPAEDLTIKAIWGINKYFITIDSDNGTTADTLMYDFGETVTAKLSEPTKEGYTFAGWDAALPEKMPAEDLIITAQWNINQYTMKFVDEDGTVIDSVRTNYSDSVVVNNPEKEGYTFVGWSDTIPATMPATDLTFTAQWAINTHYIIYVVDSAVYQTDSANYNAEIKLIDEPTKTGYTFGGWSKAPETMPDTDVTISGSFMVNQYTAAFVKVAGDTTKVTANFGDSLKVPANPTRKGYAFRGWNVRIPATMPAQDTAFTAIWDTLNYSITYYNIEEDFDGQESYNVTDSFDIETPEKQGYEFVGWTGTNWKEATKEITIKNDTGNIELTANWASATMTYTVEHLQADLSGDHSILAATDTLTGKTDSLTAAVAKTFEGFTAQKVEQVKIEPEDYATVVVIFYDRQSYTLTWDGNGGTVEGSSQHRDTVLFGEQVIARNADRTGYILSGWSGMDYGYMDMPATDLTVVAKWESGNVQYKVKHLREDLEGKFTIAQYDTLTGKTDSLTAAKVKQYEGFTAPDSVKQTAIAADGSTVVEIRYSRNSYELTWDANGGQMGNGAATMIDTIAYGDSIWMPAMAREGYTFLGWSDTLVTMPARDTTIKAQWEINKNTVVFKYSEDSVYQTITQDFGTELELPEEPTKPHYTFIGWSDTLATIPAEDTTFIDAVWAINQHTVTFGTDSTGTITAVNAKNETVASGSKVDYGTVITLTPEPASGYFFIRWSDGDTSSRRTITADTTINAIFKNEFIAGGLKYTLTSASTVAVGKIDDDHNPIGTLTIPATMIDSTDGDFFSVTAVDTNAFKGCTELTTVIVSAGITEIAYSAFRECSNLVSVSLPDGLRNIECAAFLDCGNLETINFPEGLTTIGLQAFFNCRKLTSVTFPTTFTTLGLEALGQTGLTSVNITSGLTTIDRSPFIDCYNMTEITVDAENKNYVAENGVLYNKDKTILIQYPCGKTGSQFVVPDGVTHIERYAIAYSSNLKNVALPDGVTIINFAAFFDDYNLETLTLPSSCTTILDEDAFARCPKLTIYCQAAEAPANTSAAKKVLTNCKAIKIQSADESLGTVSIATPGGYGADGSLWFPKDSTINLVASPATGYKLDKWTVADTTITSPYTISDTATITATWKPVSYSVTTISKDDGFGSVEITDGTMVDGGYEYGSEIELTATPWNYCHFVKWADDNSTDNPRTVTVSDEASYEAVFAPDTFTVTYNPNFEGATGSMAEQQLTCYDNQKLTPNAFAAEGYTFTGWATSANGGWAYGDSASTFINYNTTLYAIWIKAQLSASTSTFWNGTPLIASDSYIRSNGETYSPFFEKREWQLKLTNIAGDTVLATSNTSQLIVTDTVQLVAGKQYLLNAQLTYDGKLTVKTDLVVTASEFVLLPKGTNGTDGYNYSTYALFGRWPQTIKADDVTIYTDRDSVACGSLVYYLGSDGFYYVKCTENAYQSGYTYSNNTAVGLIGENSTKYFKVEPIKWCAYSDIRKTGRTLLIAENILASNVPFFRDSTSYHSIIDGAVQANNYHFSTIRAYINGRYDSDDKQERIYTDKGFLQSAFSNNAQSLIDTTYFSYTNDKLFLLTSTEANSFLTSSNRARKATDYVKANFAEMSGDYGSWWLRDIDYSSAINMSYCVDNSGQITEDVDYKAQLGILPAMAIAMDNFSNEPSTFFFVDEKNGSYSNNGLTANSAFDNIDSALMRMNNTSANYTICINGTLTGAQAINGSPKAKSITLCGLNGNDTLNGGFSADKRGTVLTIGTSVPVTVKNLTITGGYAEENGGGISVLAGANLTIASGTSIVNDTAYYSGGGVYTKGTCIMTGGRISNNVITFNGTTYGGGVFADWNGKFTLMDGEISHNTSSYNGGGAAAGNGATFEMLGGQINDNSARCGGGIYIMTNSSLTLNNGIVKHNSAQTSGGGVFTAYGSTTSLSCTISDNSASTGSGVYNVSKSFAVSGKAAISTNNNVYLASDATIIIAGALTADTVAVIKPYTYEARQILIGANGTAEDIIATQKERFVVTPEYNGNLWGITDDGYLQRVANIDAIVSQIEGMTESGTVVVTGYMEAAGLTCIRNALWNLYDNNQDIRVTLDMSGVVGLTKIENFSKYGSAISNLKSIILPEGITSIDIQHCYNLESITLPSTLTEFDSNNLYENYNLQTVIVPDNSVFKVDNGAIYSKDGTKLIMHFDKKTTAAFNVPEGVTTICGEAFHESKISSITFPSTLRKIGSDAFYYCEFTSVEIPDSVVLDTYAFYGCGNLTTVKLPVATTQVKYCTFAECYSLASVELPEGVTSITNNAFDNCHALYEITLPASLQSIAAGTFNNCSSLTTVNYHGTAADTVNMNILDTTIIGENVVWNFDYALYVSPEGDNKNSGTSADAPLQSLDSALTKIVMNPDTNYNYIIYIDGTLRGPQALGDSLNHRAVSITLMGANGLKDGIPQDSLAMSVGVNDRVLTIGTSTPIIIRNLAITGGSTVEEEEDGGGIYVIENSNANLTIADGALIADNSTFDSGGGIYVGLGNRALTMTGGTISGNYAYSCGGGVFVANCQFTMTGGTISHNNAENGGGAYLYTKQSTIGGNALITNNKATNEGGGLFALGNVDKATVKLTGYAKITSDTAYIRGGGVCLGYGITLAMDRHAEITNNTAGTDGGEYGAGGGVCLGEDELFSELMMTGGTISGNQVKGQTTEGAGVYVTVRRFGESCPFAMGDKAVIAADNDVYLPVFEKDSKYYIAPINIMSNLTGTAPVATITPGEYIDSLQVLEAPSTAVKENYYKFAVSGNYALGFNGDLRPAAIVDGKKYSIYQIKTGAELNVLFDTLNTNQVNCTEGICISIANDLTLENHLPFEGDKGSNFRAFKGVFDGNGHTLTVKSFSPNIKPVSLVCVYNSGIIQNAKYEFINDTTFTITEVYGTAQGLYGGFCFQNYEDGVIRNCWNAASVHVKLLGRAGGICGANQGRVENCLNTAKISGQWNKTDWNGRYGFLGGICGEIYSGIVCNCVNYGEVNMPSYYYTSPYESGSINGVPGAICGGYGEAGAIENCYIRDSCLYYSTNPNNPVAASTNMIYPAPSVRNGTATGCGYFEIDSVNTTATLYAGTSDICGSTQTLADYAENDLLKALNGYVDAKNTPALKAWKKVEGKHAAVLNFGE